uniref:Putative ovule protein n=1 Tax=Solanum chacoense TaxID=4108 RepID=A0A0V0GWL8_SOLCH
MATRISPYKTQKMHHEMELSLKSHVPHLRCHARQQFFSSRENMLNCFLSFTRESYKNKKSRRLCNFTKRVIYRQKKKVKFCNAQT